MRGGRGATRCAIRMQRKGATDAHFPRCHGRDFLAKAAFGDYVLSNGEPAGRAQAPPCLIIIQITLSVSTIFAGVRSMRLLHL